jgi:serine/threonine-protein kinase RsbW
MKQHKERQLDVVICSDLQEVRRVQEEIERVLLEHRFEQREIFSIRLALEEALVNAIKHGNQLDCRKQVFINCRVNGERFDIHIADEGQGFDPERVPDPLEASNLERPFGRGLLLMRHYMSEVTFHAPGNRVSMSMLRSSNGNGNGNGKH